MKAPLHVLLVLCAACVGYALGTLWPSAAPALPGVVPPKPTLADDGAAVHDSRMSEAAAKAFAALASPKSLEQIAEADQLLARIAPADFPKLLATATRIPSESRKGLMILVFQAWARCDPNAAQAWGAAIVAQNASRGAQMWRDGTVGAIVEEWSRTFPEDAFAFAREHWPKSGAGVVLQNVVRNWPTGDRAGCLAKLQSLPENKLRQQTVTGFFNNWAQVDSAKALAAARALPPGSERENALCQVIVTGGQLDPIRAFTLARDSAIENPLLLATLGAQGGIDKGAETARWIAQNAPELIQISGRGLITQWARRDPAAAFSWATANGVPFSGKELVLAAPSSVSEAVDWTSPTHLERSAPIDLALADKPKETIEWLNALPTGPASDDLIETALHSKASASNALALFTKLSPESQRKSASNVMAAAFGDQMAKAREWVAALPAGPVQDTAWQSFGMQFGIPADFPAGPARDSLAEYAATHSSFDPEKGLAAVAAISDPATKRSAFENLMWGALHEKGEENSVKARGFLEKAAVPEEWKRPLRESLAK